ncbi:MAG: RNA polymerase sigma factor [Planctomycetaceae bacterium]|nr:RNA polymerase sigma factor [Planctomycetaceae bacterium]
MPDSVAEIVESAKQGDRDAQRQLYESFHRQVYRLMVRMVGPQEAADLTQQVFLQTFRKLQQFAGESQFRTWLHRLAVNEALQFLRKAKRAETACLAADPADRSQDPQESVLQQDLMEQALSRLDPELRATFLLREVEELNYSEIALVMQIPEGTVGSRMNRARRELKQHLLDLGWEP